jgi:hypothetical protein
MAAAVRLQATDLAVDHGTVRSDGVRDFLRELRPRLEQMAVPRYELAAMPGHDREHSKAVDLSSNHEIRMIKRLRNSEEAHGCPRSFNQSGSRLDLALSDRACLMRRNVSANASSRRRWCSRNTAMSSSRDNTSECVLSLSHTNTDRHFHCTTSGHPSAPPFNTAGSYCMVPPHPGTVQGFEGNRGTCRSSKFTFSGDVGGPKTDERIRDHIPTRCLPSPSSLSTARACQRLRDSEQPHRQ